MKLFTFDNFKRLILELVKTLSGVTSYFSSKRIERALFTGTAISLVIGCFIYLYTHDQLTATETVILISPLLIAGGYNLNKGQQEKKDEPQ